MIRNNIHFKIILLALILGGIIVGRFVSPKDISITQPILISDFLTPIHQSTSKRTWKFPPKRKLMTIEVHKNGPLINPGKINVHIHKGIYIFDYGDQRLKQFSYNGTFIQKYGNGRGTRAGEFGNPTDFAVSEDGFVWIAYPADKCISVFNPDGSLYRTIRLTSKPYRLIISESKNIIIIPELGEYLFEIYNLSGERISSFGKIIQDQQKNALALDGNIAISNFNSFIYVPLYSGFILSYTTDQQLRFFVHMIDPMPLPKIITNATGRKHVNRKTSYAGLCINTIGNQIYILCEDEFKGTKRRIIDVYSTKKGFYLYSIPVPVQCNQVFVTKNHIYTLSKTSFSKWLR